MNEIILSVVIPTYNSDKYIQECLDSVANESQEGVEFILIDGGSQDNTMKICQSYSHLFAYMLSEPDRGQSDAFNKGFKKAKGRYLTWLNSDDLLGSGSIGLVLKVLRKSQKQWLTANCVHTDEDAKILRCCRSGGFETLAVKHGILNVFGPSTIFSKKLYEELGDIDEDFHYCMDTEYWWRIASAGYDYKRINVYLWALRLHSEAKTASSLLSNEFPEGMRTEGKTIAKKYFSEVNSKERRFGLLLARCYRLLNLSYLLSKWDTLRLKGKRFN